MKIFKLIWLEASFLRRTIILIGLILTAFVAALLSVLSVLLDVPEGMYTGLDEYLNHFTVSVKDIDPDYGEEMGGTPIYGHLNGITRYSVLTGESGTSIKTHPPKKEESTDPEENTETLVGLTVSGYAVFEAVAEEHFSKYTSALSGNGSRFPSAPGEIAINATIARMIGVTKLGQTVTFSADSEYKETKVDLEGIEPETYTVVGFVDNSAIGRMIVAHPNDYLIPSAYYYLITEYEHPMSTICFSFPDSRAQNTAYNQLTREGFEIASRNPARPMENISLAQAFFSAISLVLGAMVLFILYSLIAIFYRQRKSQICRLKLLGAKGSTIAAVYCTIAIAINFIAVAVGTGFSMLFSIYFMDLCANLFSTFSSNFVSHFRPIIPVSLFLALSAFTMVLFFVVNRKIKNTVIAQEVRHE